MHILTSMTNIEHCLVSLWTCCWKTFLY